MTARSRYLYHRATGLPVGPLVPIDDVEWVYNVPPLSQTVWRYLDLWKFESMLTTSSIYFCRCDKFPDPLEGRLSKRGVHGTSESDKAFRAAYPIAENYEDQCAGQEAARFWMFASCWSMNVSEQEEMWSCVKEPEPVAIVSSFGTLRKTLASDQLKFSTVNYISETKPRIYFDGLSVFFYKDESYRYERELRILRYPRSEGETFEGRTANGEGLIVPAKLRALIHRIVLHRTVTEKTARNISKLAKKFCPRALITRSILN